mgnify:CR=1 FL=1
MKKNENQVPMPTVTPLRPKFSEEAEEQQLMALAMQRAKEQLQNGTASSQLICQVLKNGSMQAKLERKILEVQHENIVAKTEMIKAVQRNEELFKNALSAIKTYSGKTDEDYVERF